MKIFLPRERKGRIREITNKLRQKYDIPPCTYHKLNFIASDNDIFVHAFDSIFFPICDPDGKSNHMVLPASRFPYTKQLFNFAHELGHFILEPSEFAEREAEFFAKQLTGIGYLKSYLYGISQTSDYASMVYRNGKEDYFKKLYSDLDTLRDCGGSEEFIESIAQRHEKLLDKMRFKKRKS